MMADEPLTHHYIDSPYDPDDTCGPHGPDGLTALVKAHL